MDRASCRPSEIIDDWGFHDIGFRSQQMKTPTLDKYHKQGLAEVWNAGNDRLQWGAHGEIAQTNNDGDIMDIYWDMRIYAAILLEIMMSQSRWEQSYTGVQWNP